MSAVSSIPTTVQKQVNELRSNSVWFNLMEHHSTSVWLLSLRIPILEKEHLLFEAQFTTHLHPIKGPHCSPSQLAIPQPIQCYSVLVQPEAGENWQDVCFTKWPSITPSDRQIVELNKCIKKHLWVCNVSCQKPFQLQKKMHWLPKNVVTESDKMLAGQYNLPTPSDKQRIRNK